MKITNVSIRLIENKETNRRLKAVASITFENLLTIDDILVIQARQRLCLFYPENLYHQPVVVPRIRQFSKQIEGVILDRYRKEVELLKKDA